MIQCGCRRGPVEPKKVLQSDLLDGAKIFVPRGQLLLSLDRRTSRHLVHLTRGPARKCPSSVTRLHLHVGGLPFLGVVGISSTPLQGTDNLPFASVGSGANSC